MGDAPRCPNLLVISAKWRHLREPSTLRPGQTDSGLVPPDADGHRLGNAGFAPFVDRVVRLIGLSRRDDLKRVPIFLVRRNCRSEGPETGFFSSWRPGVGHSAPLSTP